MSRCPVAGRSLAADDWLTTVHLPPTRHVYRGAMRHPADRSQLRWQLEPLHQHPPLTTISRLWCVRPRAGLAHIVENTFSIAPLSLAVKDTLAIWAKIHLLMAQYLIVKLWWQAHPATVAGAIFRFGYGPPGAAAEDHFVAREQGRPRYFAPSGRDRPAAWRGRSSSLRPGPRFPFRRQQISRAFFDQLA